MGIQTSEETIQARIKESELYEFSIDVKMKFRCGYVAPNGERYDYDAADFRQDLRDFLAQRGIEVLWT